MFRLAFVFAFCLSLLAVDAAQSAVFFQRQVIRQRVVVAQAVVVAQPVVVAPVAVVQPTVALSQLQVVQPVFAPAFTQAVIVRSRVCR